MPFINLKSAGKLTKEQKSKIAAEFADTMERVAGKPKKATYIVIEEVQRENWAIGDQLLSDK